MFKRWDTGKLVSHRKEGGRAISGGGGVLPEGGGVLPEGGGVIPGRGGEPDLFVGGLLVDDVGPMLPSKHHSQNATLPGTGSCCYYITHTVKHTVKLLLL